MDKFLKTKRGLEYLLETSPSDMLVLDAIEKAKDGAENDYLMHQIEDNAGWL